MSYIHFESAGESASGKTKLWHVLSNDQACVLGTVAWYAPWRKYAFSALSSACVFEQDCLRDIADFCERETLTHKRKKYEAIHGDV